jgi:MFS family permease
MTNIDVTALQRRVLRTLMTGQVLSGFGVGATFSAGAMLAEMISGSAAWSGAASTFSTLGAALWAIPLSRLAVAKGRRVALATGGALAVLGASTIILSAVLNVFLILIVGLVFIGAASAISLQARFSATDLPSLRSPGRDLSLVVWATTLGAVVGPNLIAPGDELGMMLGLPHLSGPFLITVFAQLAGATAFWIGLRPDPLLTARALDPNRSGARPKGSIKSALAILRANKTASYAVATISLSHMVMVAVMSMTPVHMKDMGFSLVIVGLTISIHVAGMWAFSPIFGWLSDKLGKVTTIVIAQVIYVISLAYCAFGSLDRLSLSIGLLLLGLGWSAATVAGSALLSTSITGEEKAHVQGLSDSLMSLSGAVGGAVAGLVLASVTYPGLAIVALVPVSLILIMTGLRRFNKSATRSA